MTRAWAEVSHREPCPICAHPDWCSRSLDGVWAICRRVDIGEGIRRIDKTGGEYWLYRLDGSRPAPRHTDDLPPSAGAPCADAATRDAVYCALLAALRLSPMHHQALYHRGLQGGEMLRRGYRTLPLTGRASLAKRLVERFGVDVCAQIPGLYLAEQDGRCWWSLAGAAGLLIPVRDFEGRIITLKVRADESGEGPKYSTVSSTRYGGPGPGAQAHVPLHNGARETVRVTEGEIKSDITTVLSGVLTLSVPGVGNWQAVMPVLEQLKARRVSVAFDADWRSNPAVKQALAGAVVALLDAGVAVVVETWDAHDGKGIDDVLAAGKQPRTIPASVMLHHATFPEKSEPPGCANFCEEGDVSHRETGTL